MKTDQEYRNQEIANLITTPISWFFKWGISLVIVFLIICIYFLFTVQCDRIEFGKVDIHQSDDVLKVAITMPSEYIRSMKYHQSIEIVSNEYPLCEWSKSEGVITGSHKDTSRNIMILEVVLIDKQQELELIKLCSSTSYSNTAEINIQKASFADIFISSFFVQNN